MYGSRDIGVLLLCALLIRLTSLMGYICRDHEDLSIWDLKHLARIVRGDGRASDLERKAIWGRLTVDLAAMSCEERSTKLFEHTALVSCVFGVLMDRARVLVMTFAFPMM
jgi:hypothetical protein